MGGARDVGRRGVLIGTAAGLAIGLAGKGKAARDIPPKPDRLVVNASGGAMGDAMKKAYVAVFERQTGIPVTLMAGEYA